MEFPTKKLRLRFSASEGITRLVVALAGIILAIAAGHLGLLRAGGSLITLSYDLPFVARSTGTPDDICIVYVDSGDERFRSRQIHAPLLDKLADADAKAVVYDLYFSRPAPDPTTDLQFAAAIRRFRGVDEAGIPILDQQTRTLILASKASDGNNTGSSTSAELQPVDPLRDAADSVGTSPLATDGVSPVRQLATERQGYASITWLMARAAGAPLDDKDRPMKRWINYAGPPANTNDPDSSPAIRSYDAGSVLDGMNQALLRGKIVIIAGKQQWIPGSAADHHATPFHRFRSQGALPLMTGAEMHANMLANLLRGNWLKRSSPGFDTTMIVLAGLLSGGVFSLLRPARSLLIAVTGVLMLAAAGTLSMHYGQVWFPWAVVAFAQVPAALVWGTASSFYVERFHRQRSDAHQLQLRETLTKYLSPEMMERLRETDYRVELGGEAAMATMLVTDIESYSGMCERVEDPRGVVTTLNGYFARTTGHVLKHKGVIIQFTGDSIFAAWGTPLAPMSGEESVAHAVAAAWKLFETDKLSIEGDDFRTRFGLHFGPVVAGNIGSTSHVAYALVGDAVNLVHRLEGLNKILGTTILLSGEVRAKMNGEFRTRRVGSFLVKGRQKPTEVHELLGPVVQAQEPEWITLYSQALAALEAGDRETAKSIFATVDQRRGQRGDGPSRYFLDCLNRGEALTSGVVEIRDK